MAHSLFRSATIGLLLIVGVGACNTDKVAFAPVTTPSLLIKSVRLSARAFNLATAAPYDTVRLQATALMADGSVAPGAVRFTASDTLIEVDSTGLVTALHATPSPVRVYVTLTVNGVTRSDTANISVVAGAPTSFVRNLSIEPFLLGESDFQTMEFPNVLVSNGNSGKSIATNAFDSTGARTFILLDVHSTDTTVAAFQGDPTTGVLSTLVRKPGVTWFLVSTYAYGETYVDSMRFQVDTLRLYIIDANLYPSTPIPGVTQIIDFFPGEITIPRGADVIFRPPPANCPAENPFCHGEPLDVIFDQPSAALRSVRGNPNDSTDFLRQIYSTIYNPDFGQGNIAAFRSGFDENFNSDGEGRMRMFNTIGDYPFHNSRGGTGVIHVR